MFGSQGLDLTWRPPAGGGPVLRYRIERTREGRVYEVMKEWRRCEFFFSPEPGEPWFYRVTAVNERGAGRARFVIFFCRVSRDGHAILQTIPVLPGVRITISELG